MPASSHAREEAAPAGGGLRDWTRALLASAALVVLVAAGFFLAPALRVQYHAWRYRSGKGERSGDSLRVVAEWAARRGLERDAVVRLLGEPERETPRCLRYGVRGTTECHLVLLRDGRARDHMPGGMLGRRITFELMWTPLEEALGFMGIQASVPITMGPGLEARARETRITLRLTDVETETALRWIVRLAGMDYCFEKGAILVTAAAPEPGPPPEPDAARPAASGPALPAAGAGRDAAAWERALREKLRKKVFFAFRETPLEEALGFLQTLGAAPLVMSPAAAAEVRGAKVTLELADAELGRALARVLEPAGLEPRLVHHAVLVTRAGEAGPVFAAVEFDERDPHAARTLQRLGQRMSFEFMDTPPDQAIAFVREVAAINLVLDPRATAGEEAPLPGVTMNAPDLPIRVALDWITWLSGLRWEFTDSAVYVTRRSAAEEGAAGKPRQGRRSAGAPGP